MTENSVQSVMPGWANAVVRTAREFDSTILPVLSGRIPEGLQGWLYRNGPGRLERGGQRVGHWFDGDGAVLAVHFAEGTARGLYRYIKTAGYLAEEKAGRFLFGNYGMKPPGPIWNSWFQLFSKSINFKNTANTALLSLPNKLLTLWEGGHPHALDKQTLETLGRDDLESLEPSQPFSAHPRRDPQTGEIFNIGIDSSFSMNLYACNPSGTIQRQAKIPLNGVPFLHSFVLAGPYLIFFVPPLGLNLAKFSLGFSSYSEALQWLPNKGTQIIVVDRNTFEPIALGEAEPWFQWHFGNGCVESDGMVRLDVVRFSNFAQTNEYLREMATGITHTKAKGTLWRMRLNPKTAELLETEEIVDRACEFPVVPDNSVGQPWRHTYFALHRQGAAIGREWFSSIARFDYQTETLTEADLGPNRYVVEPLYAPDAFDVERGWVLTVVYDAQSDRSEVWIFASDRLDGEPVCRLGLPAVIPLSFHGIWEPSNTRVLA